jgi:hypothetical protein
MNNIYEDKELETLFGRRPEGTALFEPQELGWACPEDKTHRITFSEFREHIWCYDCKMDYFTLLCPKILTPETTENILRKEIEAMALLIAKWTLKKYKQIRPKCNWLDCISGSGLGGRGYCNWGEPWNPDCPVFENENIFLKTMRKEQTESD